MKIEKNAKHKSNFFRDIFINSIAFTNRLTQRVWAINVTFFYSKLVNKSSDEIKMNELKRSRMALFVGRIHRADEWIFMIIEGSESHWRQ